MKQIGVVFEKNRELYRGYLNAALELQNRAKPPAPCVIELGWKHVLLTTLPGG